MRSEQGPGGRAGMTETEEHYTAGGERHRATLEGHLLRTLLWIAALVVAIWFLYHVRSGILLILVAMIVTAFLNAPVTALEKRGVGRPIAALILLMALLIVIAGLGWMIVPRLAREVPRFLELLPELATQLADRISDLAGESPELERQLEMLVAWLVDSIQGMWQYATTALEALIGGIIVVALVLFMLLNPRPILSAYIRLLPEPRREKATRAFVRASRMVVGWVSANVIVGGIRGVAAYFFLTFVGVPGALLWGVLSFVTALIPRLGFYLMTIPPVVVAAAQSFELAVWTAVFFIVFDEILGNFIAPRIYGETMELHPAYILGMTVLMALAFGVIGVLIAAPFAGIIKAHVDEFYLQHRPPTAATEALVDAMLEGREDPARQARTTS